MNLKIAVDGKKNKSYVSLLWVENGFGPLTFWVRDWTAPIRRLAIPGDRFLREKRSFWEGGRPRPPEKTGTIGVQLRFSGRKECLGLKSRQGLLTIAQRFSAGFRVIPFPRPGGTVVGYPGSFRRPSGAELRTHPTSVPYEGRPDSTQIPRSPVRDDGVPPSLFSPASTPRQTRYALTAHSGSSFVSTCSSTWMRSLTRSL